MAKYPGPGEAPTPSIRILGNVSQSIRNSDNTSPAVPNSKYAIRSTLRPRGYSDADIVGLVDKSVRYVTRERTSVLDLNSQGDIATATLDLSDYVPSRTMAVNLHLIFNDSSSSTASTNLQVWDPRDAAASLVANGPHIDDMNGRATGVCGVNNKREVNYSIEASGAATADIDIILIGYYEYII